MALGATWAQGTCIVDKGGIPVANGPQRAGCPTGSVDATTLTSIAMTMTSGTVATTATSLGKDGRESCDRSGDDEYDDIEDDCGDGHDERSTAMNTGVATTKT